MESKNAPQVPAERIILVALDKSEHSARAFDFYLHDIAKAGDLVILIHCYSPPQPPTHGIKFGSTDHEFWDEWREKVHIELTKVRGLLFSFEQMCTAKKIKSRTLVRAGKSGEEIVNAAVENGAVMIIVGTRGQNAVRRTLLGSVSDYVIRHSKIPVAVVPPTS